MATIIGVGSPDNDGEREVIAYLRDNAPGSWTVVHNLELPQNQRRFEIDLVVVTPHAVTVIDVKRTHGEIAVAGNRWYPRHRAPFASPLPKLRQHAKVLKSLLAGPNNQLRRLYVGQLVVLTDPEAKLIDTDGGDVKEVCHLSELIALLADPSLVPRDFDTHHNLGLDQHLLRTLIGSARPPSAARTFGSWEVIERLGESEDGVQEYRARNSSLIGGAPQMRLRVYPLDPYLPEAERQHQRLQLGNAYTTLWRLPGHPHIVGYHDFFVTDDETGGVLVLDDTPGMSLALRLVAHEPLTRDEVLRILRDVTSGLVHAHRHGVVHRALSPETVLVATDGRALLTGFDHAHGAGPRPATVVNKIPDAVDPAYLAPEGQVDVGSLTSASDVYALGVLGFRLLAGELPFTDPADQQRRHSTLPIDELDAAGVPAELTAWLISLCAHDPADRPDATTTLWTFDVALRRPKPAPATFVTGTADREQLRDLRPDHQLTPNLVVRRKLGAGSFGVVYQVHNVLARTDQACKLVLTDSVDPVERLSQEYAPLLKLPPHPNVVQVRHGDLLPGSDVPYLLFEYVPGTDVQRLVADGTLTPTDVRRLGIDAATGLAHIHANGVYHCDIKPGNLLWTDAGAKLIDFNVAVSIEHVLADAGSRRYLPPDYAPHEPDLADRDVYALGLTLYEALTRGNWPWDDKRSAPRDVPPRDPTMFTDLSALSSTFVNTLLRAIAPDRAARYPDAATFAAALEQASEVRRRPSVPAIDRSSISAVAGEVNNPFVEHLQTLYSQSPTSNSGTRGLDPHQFAVYVSTLLDERLIKDVLEGRHNIVIVTGNAGDGKTAFLEQLLAAALEEGATAGPARPNGANFTYRGRKFHTNLDGSQDEGDRTNDDVLDEFFAPYSGDHLSDWPEDETRLVAINEGRLVDFLRTHATRFPALRRAVDNGLDGAGSSQDGVTLVNLNARSVVAGGEDSIFDGMVARMTEARFWDACNGCALAKNCYALHNVRTLADPDAGKRITERLRTLYTVAHLRGRLHITLRDLRSALAYLLTSGRSCDDIREVHASGDTTAILSGFYFQSWLGPPDPQDRLLALLRDCDVSDRSDPALDRVLDFIGPSAGAVLMTVDGRGDYDQQLLSHLFEGLPRGAAITPTVVDAHHAYTTAARRRFFFESADPQRWRRLLSHRSAADFLRDLGPETTLSDTARTIVYAINRSEGLPDPTMLGSAMAVAIGQVRGGSIRSYRLFPLEGFSVEPEGPSTSRYVESEPDSLRLRYTDPQAPGGEPIQIAIRLDLYELLWRLRRGGVPATAERQGEHLSLTIFKHLLTSAPYQAVLLTVTGHDLHQVTRGADGVLTLTEARPTMAGREG